MQAPSTKKCPQCHKEFICNPANIAACQCSSITFTKAEREYIAKEGYNDCLCLNCLQELKQMAGDPVVR